jgi:hypothetical protein
MLTNYLNISADVKNKWNYTSTPSMCPSGIVFGGYVKNITAVVVNSK